jgi:F0F1-type ATP synthase membrane subunit a
VKKLHKKKSLDYQETSLTSLIGILSLYVFFMILNPIIYLLIPNEDYWNLENKYTEYWMLIPFFPIFIILFWYTFRKKRWIKIYEEYLGYSKKQRLKYNLITILVILVVTTISCILQWTIFPFGRWE